MVMMKNNLFNSCLTEYKKCFRKMKKNATLSAYRLSYLGYFVGRYGLARSCHMKLILKIKNLIFESWFTQVLSWVLYMWIFNCLVALIFNSSYHPLVELMFGVTLVEIWKRKSNKAQQMLYSRLFFSKFSPSP